MSASSKKVMPRSSALWTTFCVAAKSMRPPKLLQPSPTADTRRPELPRFRCSTRASFEFDDAFRRFACDADRKARPEIMRTGARAALRFWIVAAGLVMPTLGLAAAGAAPGENHVTVILDVGDSLTAGYGLPAGQAFPARLQAW